MLSPDKICAVVAASSAREMRRQLEEAIRQTRTVELRLDWLPSDREIQRFLSWLAASRIRGTFIATCRRRSGGGKYKGTIARQLLHLAEAIQSGCAWYDLEIESASQCPPELLDVLLGQGRQLRSAHFFRGMPPSLKRVAGCLEHGRPRPDAIKIAAQCGSLAESLSLLRFARSRRNVVAVPMGEIAMPVRLLSLRDGGAFTYAPVEHSTAPGQVSLADAKSLYRADRIDRRTRVYGAIGDPITHSLSPLMHNAGYRSRGMNALFLPFLVRDLKDFLASAESLGIRGFAVTIPHKENILAHLDSCDPLARKIGAVNTVVVEGDGKLRGYNTDFAGVLHALEARISLGNRRVLILGAGGAARATAFALAHAGAAVCICARRPARAKSLARAVGGEEIARGRLRREFFDAIVNTTPVGMYPQAGISPLEAEELNCRLVFDAIYRPRETKLLQLAARRGIETVSGVDMFVAQGTAQWEIWTGKHAPIAAMRRAVMRALRGEENSRKRR